MGETINRNYWLKTVMGDLGVDGGIIMDRLFTIKTEIGLNYSKNDSDNGILR
jgi:hypothetical protein